MSAPPGLTIKYQGKVCMPTPFSLTRSTGLSSGSGYVHMHRDTFKTLRVEGNVAGLDTPDTIEEKAEVDEGFLSGGDLVFSEVDHLGVEHSVTFKKVLLSENAVEVPLVFDDEQDLVRVELSDIRSLWGKRGVVCAVINVPVQKSTGTAGAGDNATREANAPVFLTESLNGALGPWTLEEVLTQIVLPNLPGSPKLKRLPEGAAGAIPTGHVWNGELAIDALRALLSEFSLELALNPDSSVSLWNKGEGDLQSFLDGKLIAYGLTPEGKLTPEIDPRVAHARPRVSWKFPPDVCVVLGSDTIEGFRSELQPVGEVDGKLLPLSEALEKIDLDLEIASRLAVLPSGRQDALALDAILGSLAKAGTSVDVAPSPERSMTEFRRWAFKWFRMPEADLKKLPILAHQARTSADGTLDAPKVSSESHGFSKALYTINSAGQKLGGVDGLLDTAALSTVYVVGFQRSYAVQAGGFTLDLERGLVKFTTPQGLLEKVGQNHERSQLRKEAHVTLEACFVRRLAAGQGYRHRYAAAFRRGKDGGLPVMLDKVPDRVAALRIVRKDMQEIVDADGNSNRDELDSLALKLAADALTPPPSIVGGVVTFCRPVDVACTGRVLSVTWSTDSKERPVVVAEIGAYTALAPDPFGTYLPPLRTRERPTYDSTSVSHGLRKGS